MNITVSGGTGYVGGTVTALLLQAGHEVTVFDRHAAPVPAGARLVPGDIREPADCWQAVRNADVVVHCAARTLVNESYADPAAYWDNNLGGTYALLNEMRKAGCSRIVFSSTAAVYGEPDSLPVAEEHPARPETPYGASKLACDTLLSASARLNGIAAVSFRYFNVAGAVKHGDRWIAGWRGPQTHLIPNVLLAAEERRPVTVNGDDYPTRDGTCIRDYIHVADLAEAHLRALDHLAPGVHEVFNLGTGTGWSVREVVQACREAAGRDIAEETGPRRRGDPVRLIASAAKAARVLGWKPERDLRQMAADAWAFMNQEKTA